MLALAEALKREKPGRTAAQVRRILQVTAGWAPSDRTLQRLFERLELNVPPRAEEERAGLRPVRVRAAERDVDRGHPPRPGDRRGEVLPFRVHRRPLPRRDGRPLGASRRRGPDGGGVPPRPAAARRPPGLYLDNGSPFVDAWLLRGCAVLGIKLIHSRPGKPEGRGKIERFFRTVRDQFLVEVGDGAADRGPGGDEPPVPGLAGDRLPPGGPLRDRRGAARPLGEGRRRQSGRSRSPPCCGRRSCGPSGARPTRPPWSRLHGNAYQVDAWLAGRYVELVFDPFDLDRVEVRLAGKPAGTAVPFAVGRHRHPKTRTRDGQGRAEPAPTGIDYLAALGDGHDAALRDQVSYQSLVDGSQPGTGRTRRKEKAVTDSPQATAGPGPRRGRGGPLPEPRHPRRGRPGQPADAYELLGELSLTAARPPAAPGPGRPLARRRPRRRAARLRRRHRPRRRGQRRLAVHLRRPRHRRRPGPRPRLRPAAARRRQRRPVTAEEGAL